LIKTILKKTTQKKKKEEDNFGKKIKKMKKMKKNMWGKLKLNSQPTQH